MDKGILKFKLLLISIAIIGLVGFLMMFFLTSPYQNTTLGIGVTQINLLSVIGMYVSLFIFFAGIFAGIFFLFKSKVVLFRGAYTVAVSSLRQGVLMGILICILLFLQSLNLLIWWDALLVIMAVLLAEMYFAVDKKQP